MQRAFNIRPFLPSDGETLDEFRAAYTEGVLEVPHGYDRPPFVETAVARRQNGSVLASLTATVIVALDPFIRDPQANPVEVSMALRQLSVALEYAAQKAGAAEVFTAVPEQLAGHRSVLEHNGWQQTAPGCIIYRKPLLYGGVVGTKR